MYAKVIPRRKAGRSSRQVVPGEKIIPGFDVKSRKRFLFGNLAPRGQKWLAISGLIPTTLALGTVIVNTIYQNMNAPAAPNPVVASVTPVAPQPVTPQPVIPPLPPVESYNWRPVAPVVPAIAPVRSVATRPSVLQNIQRPVLNKDGLVFNK